LVVQHLPLADNIIVLDNNGKTSEQGTFDQLRASDGFVAKLVLHPEILDSDPRSIPTEDTISGYESATIIKAFQGPSANDMADLARQTGDISVYKYYLKSIGWKIAMVNAMGSTVYILGKTFPCKDSKSFVLIS
jgi:ATP-binding cassette, subfamily C (CFTR/MRP), member 1